jgi:hypothetical protein
MYMRKIIDYYGRKMQVSVPFYFWFGMAYTESYNFFFLTAFWFFMEKRIP